MDTKTLISDAKARFSHNSAKAYLKEKYKTVLIDTFDNPVEIDPTALLETLSTTYNNVMTEWYAEWQELENKR